jgi:plastin-1
MGILWQIIKMGLLDDINLEQCPELYRLLVRRPTQAICSCLWCTGIDLVLREIACVSLQAEGETIEQLLALKPEQILLRWFNFHLEVSTFASHLSLFSLIFL